MTQKSAFHAVKNTLLCLLLIFAVFLVYSPFLNNDFVADDAGWLWSGKHYKEMYLTRHPSKELKDFALAPVFVRVPYYTFLRPVAVSSFSPLYHAAGFRPFPYYFFMIFLHALNTCLIFFLLKDLLSDSPAFSVNASWVCFSSALLFGTFFLSFQAVAWISCIEYLWMFFFHALCCLLYLKFLKTRRVFYYALSLLAYILSFLSLELGIMLPFLLMCMDFLFNPRKDLLPARLKPLALFFAAGFAYFVFLKFFFYPHLPYVKPKLTDLLTQRHAFSNFLIFSSSLWSNAIHPFAKVSVIHTGLPFTAQAGKILAYGLFFVLLSTAAFAARGKRSESQRSFAKIYCFFLFWTILNLLLPSLFATKAIADTFGIPQSRQIYLSSAGACCLVVFLLFTAMEIFPRHRALTSGMTVLFVLLSLYKSAVVMRTLDREYEKASRQNAVIVHAVMRAAQNARNNSTVVFVNPPGEGIRIYYGLFIPHYIELYTGKRFHVLWLKEKNLLTNVKYKARAEQDYFLKFSGDSLTDATAYYRRILKAKKL